jgi:hypothetical protein
MLGIVSVEQQHSQEVDHFRRNTRLALDNSNIFLEPRTVNIQTLVLLAMHGEDYASPSLSWMLIGHACRQVEALGLHSPKQSDFQSYQRSLCLFWFLFMIDKSCALAFGRSSFLPSQLYRNVPFPDQQFLLKFRPHEVLSTNNTNSPPHISKFGGHFMTRAMELSKVLGYTWDILVLTESAITDEHVRVQLDQWYRNTNQVCYTHM